MLVEKNKLFLILLKKFDKGIGKVSAKSFFWKRLSS